VALGKLMSAQKVIEDLPLWVEDYTEKASHKGLKLPSPKKNTRRNLSLKKKKSKKKAI
jgi:hypothetical protein